MRIQHTIVFLCSLFFLYTGTNAQPEKLWEIKDVYKAPESVAFDQNNNVIYISNYTERVNNGSSYGNHSVSKANLNGELLKYDYVTGLTSPTGIECHKDKLFIVERFGIIVFDVKANKVSSKYYIKAPGFINDISVDNSGNMYVSVSDTNIIYRIKDGVVEKWLEDDRVSHTNGVFADENHLIVGVNNDFYLKSVDLTTKEIKNIAFLGEGNIDGIKKAGTGYLVSLFQGKLLHVDASGKVTELLNTEKEKTNMADFEFIPEHGLILMPALWNNKLIGYKYQQK